MYFAHTAITMTAEQTATYLTGSATDVRALMADLIGQATEIAERTCGYVEIFAGNGELFELVRPVAA